MQQDDIIAEIRAYREAYAARFGYDLDAMFRDIQERQNKSGRVLLQPPADARRIVEPLPTQPPQEAA